MKLNVNVEKLIRDTENSIWLDCSYDNIKHCDEYPRENLIVFKLEIEPLNIFRYLSRDDAKELYNELFIKDDRILKALKVFAKRKHFDDVAIEQHNNCFGIPKPMLLLYKSKDEYVKEVINEYCYCINYESKSNICYYGSKTAQIDLRGSINEYFVPRADDYDFAFLDKRVLKELKSFAIKHGYDGAEINGHLQFMLYKIDTNKK